MKPTSQPEMHGCIAIVKGIDQDISAQVEIVDINDNDWDEVDER